MNEEYMKYHIQREFFIFVIPPDITMFLLVSRDDVEAEFIEYYGAKKGAGKWKAAAQGAASTGTAPKPCTVCGKTNHTKADCKLCLGPCISILGTRFLAYLRSTVLFNSP